jgi:transcriptional regulator GlxA family with amidase domain
MPRHIRFFLFPGFQLLDLSGPLAAFQAAGAYRWSIASEHGGAVASSAGVAIATETVGAGGCDTFLIPGGSGVHACAGSPATVALVREAAGRADRIATVCTGAFLLAATGLLDGRRATTHWAFGGQLQSLHPRVRVDSDRIFVRDGTIWTSAGVTAGIDLALAMIDADLGFAASRAAARRLVVYHRRPGGQSQFSALLEMEPRSDRIRLALRFARDHLHEKLPVERLAEAACLSPRQFGRAFLAETGQTPAKAVERLRAEAARPLVEDSDEPLDAIARGVGFADPERLRQSFIRAFGQPPQALRRAAREVSQRESSPARRSGRADMFRICTENPRI